MDRLILLKINVLLKQSQLQAVDLNDFTSVRGFCAREQPECGCFARTVAANETDPLAGIHLERDTAKDLIASVGFCYV